MVRSKELSGMKALPKSDSVSIRPREPASLLRRRNPRVFANYGATDDDSGTIESGRSSSLPSRLGDNTTTYRTSSLPNVTFIHDFNNRNLFPANLAERNENGAADSNSVNIPTSLTAFSNSATGSQQILSPTSTKGSPDVCVIGAELKRGGYVDFKSPNSKQSEKVSISRQH